MIRTLILSLIDLLYITLYKMIPDDEIVDGEILPILDTARDDFKVVVKLLKLTD